MKKFLIAVLCFPIFASAQPLKSLNCEKCHEEVVPLDASVGRLFGKTRQDRPLGTDCTWLITGDCKSCKTPMFVVNYTGWLDNDYQFFKVKTPVGTKNPHNF